MREKRLPLEQVILGFLMGGPRHGYDLHQAIESDLGRTWRVGISNVYAVLKQLERSGWVAGTLAPQESRPPRKVYQITPAGQEAFLQWMRRPVMHMRAVRIEFLTKLYFYRALDLDGAADLIVAQEAVCRERVAQLESSGARCEERDFDRLVFDFRRRQVNAILDWLGACRREMAA